MAEDTATQDAPTLDTGITEADTATAVAPPAEQPAPTREPAEPKYGYWWGTGRRKAAVARVRIKAGDGKYLVNGKEVDVYFTEMRDRNDVRAPLVETKLEGGVDVYVNTHGGGFMGQAGAIKLGLARAIKDYDPSLEPILRDHDFLSRDPRKVERKKPGQPGARKRFQFSKR